MAKSSDTPRLTKYLKVYSDVSAPWSSENIDCANALSRKKIEYAEKNNKYFNLAMVKSYFSKNATIPSSDIDLTVKDLLNLSKDIAGSDSSSAFVESSVIFLIELFRDSTIAGKKHELKLRRMFGSYDHTKVIKVFNIVRKLVESLNSDIYEEFRLQGFPKNTEDLMKEEFGHKIKFEGRCALGDAFYALTLDSGENEGKMPNSLSFKFEPSTSKGPSEAVIFKPPSNVKIKFDRQWLEVELRKILIGDPEGISTSELAITVLHLLKSKTKDELQHELVELLGYHSLDLISDILKHRDEIIQTRAEANSTESSDKEKRPTCMTQVVIQSETERLLSKQIRKDEKRIQKDQTRVLEEKNTYVLDPQRLKQYREEALVAAQNTPIFRYAENEPVMPISCIYPNVYDIYQETKMSASFISGKKLALPANAVRVNDKLFEEIRIPATTPIGDKVNVKHIKINQLDEIGQIAFKGTEELNRIQSMVFNTAYNTNNNMLVCAPTGAGKTNVAMLTIIHEIKNNIENGIIQKNKFKIVYVAPMKALAAEMVRNFGGRLKALGIAVKELTGDMQLTKTEILQTQMLVTTPEKWDVVTRKATGDVALAQLVKLLILDEVHLLDSDRGPVLEALVARTLRQVESSQSMIRIIGLSATLPNYINVATFLRVNPMIGLYFFDDRFRPVPLAPTFIGIKATNTMQQIKDMDDVCYQKIVKLVEKHQVMVFVHARNATVRTAMVLRDIAQQNNDTHLFTSCQDSSRFGTAKSSLLKSRNKQLRELFEYGFAIHHAGMLRSDRNLVEKYFSEGLIKVLVCTSTLAWGVNLPARAVIIKGTEVYDSNKGNFVDLSVLDVMQIFGRAGRPQFDNRGEGFIITSHDKLSHYLSILTRQHEIESKFNLKLADNLNAEIALGTVSNVEEGAEWLSYTYLLVRMLKNPHAYGVKPVQIQNDHMLYAYRKSMIEHAAKQLHEAHMIRYEPNNGFLHITDMGRTASHFYISAETVNRFNAVLKGKFLHDSDIFKTISSAQEFDQLKVRDDELPELDRLMHDCYLVVPYGAENHEGKVNILLQSYLSRQHLEGFSLISDQAYVAQNATRIARSLFEICLRKNWAMLTASFLRISKMLERKMWSCDPPACQSPLHQFPELSMDVLSRIDRSRLKVDQLLEMEAHEMGERIRCFRDRHDIMRCLQSIPNLGIETTIQPITDSILKITLNIKPDFKWNDKYNGSGSEAFWIWICDPDTDYIYHSEYFILPRKQVKQEEVQSLVFTIPFPRDQKPSQYIIRAVSDRWLGSDRQFSIAVDSLILPQHRQPHTDLLTLSPLPTTALKNSAYQSLYKFDYFNPIQTQIFHTLYHTDNNVLLGAPTGSGKTIAAEIAMFRVFNLYKNTKIVYIGPLKALVRERIEDWKVRFTQKLGKSVIELTGDVTPDAAAIAKADIIVTTPEKWDGVSRSWQTRNYVKAVSLIVIDEIHLLGEDRGPVLEVIVSRTNFISAHTERKLRIIGLSTALANAQDIGNWLGIKGPGLYNFRSSVRPVQLEIHVSGYHGKHYCPRMALMNKPTYQAIRTHSPDKPSLVFVSSRRQTRLTAMDLTSFLVTEDNPRQWMHMNETELNQVIQVIRDQNLKLTIAFGIGLHHAGLHERDRRLVEELFLNQKIQVLIATATLAWGINLPAHLVVIKGTEYFDGKVSRYVDFPITDVMQMAGRAGRPQFDDTGVAVVLVHDIKKNFYKRFLHEPFPVESSLIKVLPEHINAEVVAGTISTRQQCLDYLTWTYFFRRLIRNPAFYGLENAESEQLNYFLSAMVKHCLENVLQKAQCIIINEDEQTIAPTVFGKIASYYYLSHRSILVFTEKLFAKAGLKDVLKVLCDVHEYEELPVRHNEDSMNQDLAKRCRLPVDPLTYDSPHTKAHLLLQSHFSQLQLPCADYATDLKSVLDQAIRIIQAIIDVSADRGWLGPTLSAMVLLQMILQSRWHDDNPLLTLPHMDAIALKSIKYSSEFGSDHVNKQVDCLPRLIARVTKNYELLALLLRNEFDELQIRDIHQTLSALPMLSVDVSLKGWWEESVTEETKPLRIDCIRGKRPDSQWLQVHANQEYVLNVSLKRLSKFRSDTKAIAPKFPKQKVEGWFLVLGSTENNELLAMKRLPHIARQTTHQLVFYTPEELQRVTYKLFLMSDCYLGLDQQYDICLNVIEPSVKAQINTEILDTDSSSEEED